VTWLFNVLLLRLTRSVACRWVERWRNDRFSFWSDGRQITGSLLLKTGIGLVAGLSSSGSLRGRSSSGAQV
jgi:hypothetical protein